MYLVLLLLIHRYDIGLRKCLSRLDERESRTSSPYRSIRKPKCDREDASPDSKSRNHAHEGSYALGI
jgi:hypothetical protein